MTHGVVEDNCEKNKNKNKNKYALIINTKWCKIYYENMHWIEKKNIKTKLYILKH